MQLEVFDGPSVRICGSEMHGLSQVHRRGGRRRLALSARPLISAHASFLPAKGQDDHDKTAEQEVYALALATARENSAFACVISFSRSSNRLA